MQHNYYNELWETYVTDFKEAFTIHKGIIQCGPSENQKMKFFITKWENFAIAESFLITSVDLDILQNDEDIRMQVLHVYGSFYQLYVKTNRRYLNRKFVSE